jgi:cytochrome c biogenesis protein CcmG/thiol:disulfide interchange protein DsbE
MGTEGQFEAPPPAGSATEPPGRGRAAGIAVFVVVLLAVVGVVGFMLAPRGTSSATTIGDTVLPADPRGEMAPDFTAARLDGTGSLALSELRGKPVVLNFWASWCTTCKAEAEAVSAAEKAWRAKGVVFLGVDARDTDDAARAYEKTYDMQFPSIVDKDSRITARYLVTGFPETFFIDREGRVVAKFISSLDRETLDQLIAETLAAPGSTS